MSTSKTWPGGATGAVATSYSIPAAGEFNWANLSDFLIALADGAQATTFQKVAVRKATSSPVTVATTDCAVVTDLSVAGAVTVDLPAGANKQLFYIADGKGDAATNNITINRNGSDTIRGATSLTISTNYGGVILVFNSGDTDWKVLGFTSGTTPLNNPMDSAGDMIYGGASGVATKLDSGSSGQVLSSGGAGAPSWTDTLANLITFSTGLTLPSSGGTPSTLNYYEESSYTSTFTFDGSGGTSGTVTIKLLRVGSMVTATIGTAASACTATTGTSSTTLSANTTMPSRFRPAALVGRPVFIREDATFPASPGMIRFGTGGTIEIFRNNNQDAWPNATGTCGLTPGVGDCTITYSVV